MKKLLKTLRNTCFVTLATASVCMLGAWAPAYSALDAEPPQDRYADVYTYSTYATETISFTSKDDDIKYNNAPLYTALSGMSNACGAVAGAEIVSYYDKYYANMIPDWQSYYTASGKYRLQDKVYVPNVMNELYTLMRTNVDDVGVSDSDFTSGLTQYINGRGYSVSLQNVVSGSSIDFEACKSAINNNKVIALLSRATNVYGMGSGTNQDNINSYAISGLHIMVASGYEEIKYYNGNNLFRTDRYLIVSTGLPTINVANYKLNPHDLNYAYIVNIA